jgi:hypothetical protein
LTFNTGAWTITNSTRTINVTNTGTTTIAGVIGQTGVPAIGLVKDGPGLLVLSGANTYGTNSSATSGFYLSNTTVRAGELRATNSTGSATGGSTVTVNSGGTLSGTGFIVPAQTTEARNLVSINTGGTIKPGSSPGTLTVGSAVTLGVTTATVNINAGGAFGFQYNTGVGQSSAGADTGGSGTFGVTNNHLTVNGTLNVNGGAIFKINGNFADYTPNLPYSYQVHSATAMSPFNITNPGQFDTSGFAGFVGFSSVQWHNVGNVAYFNFTPVPEPLHVLLIGGVAMLGGGWVRRRIRAPRGG